MRHFFKFILLFQLAFLGCNNAEPTISEDGDDLSKMTLADFVELDSIQRVEMHNNSGTFQLSPPQLENFKADLGKMTYEPNMTAKVGIIYAAVQLNGEECRMATSTHGEYLELDSRIITKNTKLFEDAGVYFKMNGVNFDNYKAD